MTAMMEITFKATAEKQNISYEQAVEESKSIIPQGEFIEPDDIASAVLFLVSDEARYITGTQMIVDGGLINCESFPWAQPVDTREASA